MAEQSAGCDAVTRPSAGSCSAKGDMNYKRLFAGFALLNATVFFATTIFLPRTGNFSYSTGNPLSYYINSRTDWHIAWIALGCSIMLSLSIYLMITSKRN